MVALMLMIEQYKQLARYNRRMNEKIYAVCAELSAEALAEDRGAFFGSVLNTLNHILLADRAWLTRLTEDPTIGYSYAPGGGIIEVKSLDQILYDDFEILRKERARTDHQIELYAGQLEDDELEEEMSYHTSSGQACRHPRWWAITHLFSHQTHHRGQVTTLLSQLGKDVGVTDFAVLLRNEQK